MSSASHILVSEDLTVQNSHSSSTSMSNNMRLNHPGEQYNLIDIVIDIVVSALDVSAYALTELCDIVEWIVCSVIGKEYAGIARRPPKNIMRRIARGVGFQIPVQPMRSLAVSIEEFVLRKLQLRHEERRACLLDVYDPEYQAAAYEAGTAIAPVEAPATTEGQRRPAETPVAIDADRLSEISKNMALWQSEYDELMGNITTPAPPSVSETPSSILFPPLTTPSTRAPPPPPPPPIFSTKPVRRVNTTRPSSDGSAVVAIGDIIQQAKHKPLKAVPGSRSPGGTITKKRDSTGIGIMLMRKFQSARRSIGFEEECGEWDDDSPIVQPTMPPPTHAPAVSSPLVPKTTPITTSTPATPRTALMSDIRTAVTLRLRRVSSPLAPEKENIPVRPQKRRSKASSPMARPLSPENNREVPMRFGRKSTNPSPSLVGNGIADRIARLQESGLTLK